MTATDSLHRLAALAGIEDGWWDFFGQWREVPAESKRLLLAAMGLDVADEHGVWRSLHELETRPWRRWLEPVLVWRADAGAPQVAVTLPRERDDNPLAWTLDEELGAAHSGRVTPAELPLLEEREIDGVVHRRRLFTLPATPPLGYHRLRLVSEDHAEAWMNLIVAPARAYEPEELCDGGRVWGVATQAYALRRPDDWGAGDYTAVAHLARQVGRLGAAAVGVNPLHALFPNRPERYGPYGPSSRVFLSAALIDVAAVPDYGECAAVREWVEEGALRAELEDLRRRELIDWPGVNRRKMAVLRRLYDWFRGQHLRAGQETERGRAFRRFQRDGGRPAELFATFEALQAWLMARDPHLGYWRHWPQEYRHPDSPAVAAFTRERREDVEFFWYLQWQADAQLAEVAGGCAEMNMPVGLYADLAVGIAQDGGEAWARQDAIALGVSVGAPPDPLSLKGQDWGVAPFNPVALREAAYGPFIDVLRANMRHAGALRLDHAMQLQRLYWVPHGHAADEGAYVTFPLDDLLGLVALESRRNRCLVIGEDLGTVPEGFRERMLERGVYGYRLLVFERRDDGSFKPPEEFMEHALVIFGTHDLPSLPAFWRGNDVEERARHQLYPRPEQADEERAARAEDRRRLVGALAAQGLLPEDFPTGPELSGEDARRLMEAVHAYLDRAPSRLMMVQIEDVLGLAVQMNLPGTTAQHPNWRYRYPLEVRALATDERLRALARRLYHGRCAPGQRPVVELD